MKFLVIEDDVFNREYFHEMLTSLGEQVVIAGQACEAWELIQSSSFDVVLTDIDLPDMNGFDLTAVIRNSEDEHISTLPVIGITVKPQEEDYDRALSVSMNALLSKPINIQKLYEVINTAGGRVTTEKDNELTQATDFRTIKDLYTDIGRDSLENLIGIFLSSLSEGIEQLESLIDDEGAAHTIKKLAHRLSGSCASYGAKELSELFYALESSRMKNDSHPDKQLMEEIKQSHKRLIESIDEFLASIN